LATGASASARGAGFGSAVACSLKAILVSGVT
jgi:hypothetical protein